MATSPTPSTAPTSPNSPNSFDDNMYDELLYHLDLCILAYHLYHQTLIWPMDPFYEQQAAKGTCRRENFMSRLLREGPQGLVEPGTTAPAYRGPGKYSGWASNDELDPIITDYSRLNPWAPSIVKNPKWEFIQPSIFITDRICSVAMCRNTGDPNGQSAAPQVDSAPRLRPAAITNADKNAGKDRLYCFEGGTGSVLRKQVRTNFAWSMMGFVLVRYHQAASGPYDVHIAFRGSRSGSVMRGAWGGLTGWGNPDWVTDMGWDPVTVPAEVMSPNTVKGADKWDMANGFTQSLKSCLGPLQRCLSEIEKAEKDPPTSIYITGHSLGGALAALCACAAKLGERDGWPVKWPWRKLRLLTYSAPTVGDVDFGKAATARLHADRINLGNDVITARKISGTAKGSGHVGNLVELPPLEGGFRPSDSHDYKYVREQIIKFLKEIGVDYDEKEDTTEVARYKDFSALLAERSDKLSDACGPDFNKHLKEYLTVLRANAGDKDSWPEEQGRKGARAASVNELRSKVCGMANASDAKALWDSVKWMGQDDLNDFFALCLVLSLTANSKPIDGLSDLMRAALTRK